MPYTRGDDFPQLLDKWAGRLPPGSESLRAAIELMRANWHDVHSGAVVRRDGRKLQPLSADECAAMANVLMGEVSRDRSASACHELLELCQVRKPVLALVCLLPYLAAAARSQHREVCYLGMRDEDVRAAEAFFHEFRISDEHRCWFPTVSEWAPSRLRSCWIFLDLGPAGFPHSKVLEQARRSGNHLIVLKGGRNWEFDETLHGYSVVEPAAGRAAAETAAPPAGERAAETRQYSSPVPETKPAKLIGVAPHPRTADSYTRGIVSDTIDQSSPTGTWMRRLGLSDSLGFDEKIRIVSIVADHVAEQLRRQLSPYVVERIRQETTGERWSCALCVKGPEDGSARVYVWIDLSFHQRDVVIRRSSANDPSPFWLLLLFNLVAGGPVGLDFPTEFLVAPLTCGAAVCGALIGGWRLLDWDIIGHFRGIESGWAEYGIAAAIVLAVAILVAAGLAARDAADERAVKPKQGDLTRLVTRVLNDMGLSSS